MADQRSRRPPEIGEERIVVRALNRVHDARPSRVINGPPGESSRAMGGTSPSFRAGCENSLRVVGTTASSAMRQGQPRRMKLSESGCYVNWQPPRPRSRGGKQGPRRHHDGPVHRALNFHVWGASSDVEIVTGRRIRVEPRRYVGVERQLDLRWRARQVDGWRVGGYPQVIQDSYDSVLRDDSRDDLHSPGAPGAFQNVDQGHPPDKGGPWKSSRRSRRSLS